jgi:2-polyprenyl-3-methyl-5-hydroxy-6-metoxy-1,4-benzoquinol methylase
MSIKGLADKLMNQIRGDAPLKDPEFGQYPLPFIKLDITDANIAEVNKMLDWHAGTVLKGQILGRLGVKANKRAEPQIIPDYRIVKLNELLGLKGKSVLEVGCFEGIHTLGLRLFCEDVTAIDIRPSNVIKTLARLSLSGSYAKVFVADVEQLPEKFGTFDLIFHCGVLYHLMSPVEQIFALAPMCKQLFLDTHIARDEKSLVEKKHGDFSYKGAFHDEGGWVDPFSGKDPKAFWLTQDSLVKALERAGFASVKILETREERNGPRLAILASRSA